MFPPLNSSPLISRQQLTTLREEPPHPRAYSFSGHSREPRSRVTSRAMSLSSGRDYDAGRLHDDRNELLYGEQYCYGGEPAPPVYQDERSITEEELAGFHAGERVDNRHTSWQQPYPSNHAAMFAPPAAFHASAPQFHTGANELATHRSYPDQMPYHNSEAMMKEMGGVRADNVSSQTSHWPNISEQESDLPPLGAASSGSYMADSRSFAASPSPAPMNAHSSERSRTSSDRAHARTNSTATASALVAHLSSSIKSETLEGGDNPFEPIPLGGAPKKKARSQERARDRNW